mmetsp:Transcript_82944/g.130786  ORF Transcript_82944/g.130786 Transcript_82944/m.130786 type:complete len:136 (+) Transcript_82944:67-474(+)
MLPVCSSLAILVVLVFLASNRNVNGGSVSMPGVSRVVGMPRILKEDLDLGGRMAEDDGDPPEIVRGASKNVKLQQRPDDVAEARVSTSVVRALLFNDNVWAAFSFVIGYVVVRSSHKVLSCQDEEITSRASHRGA